MRRPTFIAHPTLTASRFNRESVNKYVFYLRVFGQEDMLADTGTEESRNNESG
jgi:hypothetical protein